MKPNKDALKLQRQVMEKKLKPWLAHAPEKKPPAGWLKAIRGALGMTTQQLADRLGIDQAGITRHEAREQKGTITLETMNAIARAMQCKVVYAIVPDENFQSLDAILENQAHSKATEILKKVSHSMRLEAQEISDDDKQRQLLRLAAELKEKMDSRLWSKK